MFTGFSLHLCTFKLITDNIQTHTNFIVAEGHWFLGNSCNIHLSFLSSYLHHALASAIVDDFTLLANNLVRWVRTVHERRVLPVHRHRLFKVMPRWSPCSGECKSSCNVRLLWCCCSQSYMSSIADVMLDAFSVYRMFADATAHMTSVHHCSTFQNWLCTTLWTKSHFIWIMSRSAFGCHLSPWYLGPDIQAACFCDNPRRLLGQDFTGRVLLTSGLQ